MSTVVPTLCWIPKGVAKQTPDKVELSRDEVQKLLETAHGQLQSLGIEEKCCSNGKSGGNDEEARAQEAGEDEEEEERRVDEEGCEEETIEDMYDLQHYDSEEEHGVRISGAGMGHNLAGLTYYPSNRDDPYITLKEQPVDEDDREDYQVYPSDNLLVVGRAEEDFSSIEVHVFSEEEDHSYSHHEVLLTSFPLALEWLDYDPEQPEQKGNYIAVGTMTPVVEVWDMDTIDVLEPVFTLGDEEAAASGRVSLGSSKEKKKKKKKAGKKDKGSKSISDEGVIDGHGDAVLAISWNRRIRNILATASADKTVRVWDLAWPKTVLLLKHQDKVQCCVWHPYEPQLLATGAYDGDVCLFNCKASESAVQTWNVTGEVEKIIWNQFKPEQLLACSEKQKVWCLNKDDGSVVFQIHAHHSEVVDLSLSCYVPGLLVTAGTDDSIKFWDIQDNKPVFLLRKDMHMGGVMCCKFCVDSPYAVAVGGNKNGFHLLNVLQLPDVAKRFEKRDLLMPVTEATPTSDGASTTPSSDDVLKGTDSQHVATASGDSIDVEEEEAVMEVNDGDVKGAEDDCRASGSTDKGRLGKIKKKNKLKKKYRTKRQGH